MHNDLHFFLREECLVSGRCVETCYSQALQLNGRFMTVGEVMDEVLLDRAFYKTSGGGITLSGGEPALSNGFAQELLTRCKKEGLHTAIETCGEYPWASLEGLLPVTDLIMMDLKQMAPDKHQVATGKSNDRILANARTLALTEKPIVFRTPIVPTVNDTEEEIGQIASFVRELIELRTKNGKPNKPPITYELLTFHKLASDKYGSLGLEYDVSTITPPTRERMSELAEVARRHGVEVRSR
jgi:pyruvate formate lyase activating enzyme